MQVHRDAVTLTFCFQLRFEGEAFVLQCFVFGDVADDGDDQRLAGGLQRTQADLDWKLAAIFAAADEIEAETHGTHPWILHIGTAVPAVYVVKALRYQTPDRLAD